MKREITILEDDQDIREICTYLFKSEGFRVNEFATISSFMQTPTFPDLFLLDIRLPDGNGIDVCSRLKSDPTYAMIPVIMMSAHMDRSIMLETCNAEDFIEKPFNILNLLTRAEQLIHQSGAAPQ